jgi:hypothetical protein
MAIHAGEQHETLDEVVLFAFDNRAFPFQNHVQTHLISGGNAQRVVVPGPPGSHDEAILYYGTVLRVEDQLRMWYFGRSDGQGEGIGHGYGRPGLALCYATSSDGITWEKPDLGLVEFSGSKHNNIVDLPDSGMRPAAAILYEPDDHERPYKLAYESTVNGEERFCVAFSQDGLRWQPSPLNPVGPFLEMAGVTRMGGLYYVVGQGPLTGHQPMRIRHLSVFASKDFEHWSPCGALGLNRATDLIGPSNEHDWNHIEEVHLGAGLWNRGNVLIGIYGQWHGHPSGDRRFVTMDLGLAISHDAIHYVEPIPGFKLIPAREQPDSPDEFPALMQGQGMENIGDQTLYWYSLWRGTQGTGVRLVTWECDRLGYLQPFKPNAARVITCPLTIQGRARVYVNASGLGEYSHLRVTVLDEGFQPIDGYNGAKVNADSLRAPLIWEAGDALNDRTIRLDVQFAGVRPEDCKLHALYVVKDTDELENGGLS